MGSKCNREPLNRLGRDYEFRNGLEIRAGDVRLRTERIEDLPRSCHECGGVSRAERAYDIPGKRCHESEAIRRQSERVCDRLVRFGGRLEVPYRFHRERSFE